MLMRSIVASSAAAFCLLVTTAVRGESQDPLEQAAREECDAGQLEAGIKLFAKLYEKTGKTKYIFFQGRCYQKNDKPRDALEQFEKYVARTKRMQPEDQAKVDKNIAECRAAIAEDERRLEEMRRQKEAEDAVAGRPGTTATDTPAPGPEPSPDSPGPVGPALPPQPLVETVALQPQPTAETARPGSGLRTAGIVVGATGVAAVGAGIVLGLASASIRDQITSDAAKGSYDRANDDRGRLYSRLQWVGYGVGAAAISSGVVLYYLGYRAGTAGQPQTALHVVPTVSPGEAGMALQGRF
jgi:hypothetical protein